MPSTPLNRPADPPLEAGGRAARKGDTGWRARLRKTPGGALALKAGVLVVGSLFILLGLAAAVLPGPLTIPPMLLGLYVLASEFDWADRLLQRAKRSAEEAWRAAKKRPVFSGVTTVGGLILAGVAIWAVGHYNLVAQAKDAVGL
ncbi:MAG: hypothetical protein JWN57_1358 [Frankiales bacterium]|jgi:hypothetical protein|nr:hypothetical protein [Frankiales bacterium]